VALGTARRLLGVPYLWGGTSPAAVDCSGLTWLAWGMAGTRLPRDAWMQARDVPAIDPEETSPGDLLFFGEPQGRVSHVAIVESGRRFIHAQGFVRTGSLDPHDPDFHPRLSTILRGAASPTALACS
jgi:cell wall-associated NlpC family hydrolase